MGVGDVVCHLRWQSTVVLSSINWLQVDWMGKPKGGRGKTVPFDRSTVKVPEPVKGVVREVIDEFYDVEGESVFTSASLEAAEGHAKQVLKGRKGAKQSMENLLKKLYGVKDVSL